MEDETTQPEVVAPPVETIGGSALLAKSTKLLPRRGDRALFGKDKGATVRLSSTVLAGALLLVLAGPPLGRLLSKLPLVGSAIDQLDVFAQYPGAYGMPWFLAAFGALTAAGVVVAQMETSAHKLGLRENPGTRLNIALAAIITLALVGVALSLGKASGWVSAGASVTFFVTVCLLIPVANLPGARAMQPQAPRAWGILLLLAVAGFAIQPSVPTAVIAVLAFLKVRTNWAAISSGGDAEDGPVDRTNRLSALIIVGAVLIVASVGMRGTTISAADLAPTTLDRPTVMPGAERGPVIPPPTP